MVTIQCTCGQDNLVKFKSIIRMGKKWDLSLNLAWLLVPDWLFCIYQTADLMGFSSKTISRVYRKEKISSGWQLWGRKWFVDVKGQRRMGILVWDHWKATVTQITNCYNHGMQNILSECRCIPVHLPLLVYSLATASNCHNSPPKAVRWWQPLWSRRAV